MINLTAFALKIILAFGKNHSIEKKIAHATASILILKSLTILKYELNKVYFRKACIQRFRTPDLGLQYTWKRAVHTTPLMTFISKRKKKVLF